MSPRPPWTYKGFLRPIYASINNEINYQIAQLRKAGLEPSLVRLGSAASVVYAEEHWNVRVGEGPEFHEGHKCKVPIRYYDSVISGVFVEGH